MKSKPAQNAISLRIVSSGLTVLLLYLGLTSTSGRNNRLFYMNGPVRYMSADTIAPVLSTILSPLKKQAHGKKDSLVNSVRQNITQADSLVPKSGTARRLRKAALSLHGALPNPSEDTIASPAPTAIAWNHGSCKSIFPQPIWVYDTVKVPFVPDPVKPVPAPKTPFLQVHGNIMYNVNYYSQIDTPYNEHDIYQHTVQTYLDILVKGQYPMRIFLTNRFSNSPLFSNYSDFNFSYTNSLFNQSIKDQLKRQYLDSLPSRKRLDSLLAILNGDMNKLNMLNGWMNNPGLIQKLVEAREQAYFAAQQKAAGVAGQDSTKWPKGLSYNSLFGMNGGPVKGVGGDTARLDSIYQRKAQQADSLRKEIATLQLLLEGARQTSQADINGNLQKIQSAGTPDQLQNDMRSLHLSDSSLPKGYKTLMAVKSFRLGRSVVDYSELSAKNISINGVQLEYNPSNYYAVATGAIDYQFRDFLLQQPGGQPSQYMNVLRYGRGLRDGNSIILTYFQGHRQLYSSSVSDSGGIQVPSSSLMGLTLQGNYKITKQIQLIAEIAKSSVPAYVPDSARKSSAGEAGQLFQMNDRSNEAYSLKASAFFPATQTRVKASFERLGENYQSFSVFTDGSALTAWSGSIDQLLFRKQLDVALSAYTNDFSNPYLNSQYNSTTVFKSIQVTLRKPKWPVLSIGYFPSSQLTQLGNGSYVENLFYTLVGNGTYSYIYHKILMNTTLVYTEFYNRALDSGFAYFNTRNLLLSQSVFLKDFTLTANASAAANQDYDLYTLEGKAEHTLSKNLSIGAGVKYNDQTVYNIQLWGYSADLTWRMGQLGQLQFSADKGFIPGMNNVLVPDNTGHLTYFKTF
jgi:hypothetical protein